jgi:hypothetical protein
MTQGVRGCKALESGYKAFTKVLRPQAVVTTQGVRGCKALESGCPQTVTKAHTTQDVGVVWTLPKRLEETPYLLLVLEYSIKEESSFLFLECIAGDKVETKKGVHIVDRNKE